MFAEITRQARIRKLHKENLDYLLQEVQKDFVDVEQPQSQEETTKLCKISFLIGLISGVVFTNFAEARQMNSARRCKSTPRLL